MSLIVLPKRNQGGVGNSTFFPNQSARFTVNYSLLRQLLKGKWHICSVFPIFLIFNEEIPLKKLYNMKI
jgi:hypothetical protein